jgi:hypothetical protein
VIWDSIKPDQEFRPLGMLRKSISPLMASLFWKRLFLLPPDRWNVMFGGYDYGETTKILQNRA